MLFKNSQGSNRKLMAFI